MSDELADIELPPISEDLHLVDYESLKHRRLGPALEWLRREQSKPASGESGDHDVEGG